MNKRKKIFIIFIIIIEIFIVNSNYSYADRAYKMEQDEKATSNPSSQEKTESQQSSLGDVFSQADNFITKGKIEAQKKEENTDQTAIDENKLKDVFSNIFNMGIGIGMALTVVIGGILGIKFMIASAEDKAKIKEMMIPYVIGCIVIFGAFAIWKFIVNILNNIG